MQEGGFLYIVATPIGNLGDITLRAIETLKKVKYIACEDTRKTGLLFKKLEINDSKVLISYYEQTEKLKLNNILNLLINGEDVVLVSDSGTPLISDPGYPLVRECIKQNIKVVSIPGPSAAISALVSSGLPPDKFLFMGFLPRKSGNRKTLLKNLLDSNKKIEATIIIYEAPHRLVATLNDIKEVFGNIKISVARELTKIYEENFSIELDELIIKYEEKDPKGEFVIMFSTKDLN